MRRPFAVEDDDEPMQQRILVQFVRRRLSGNAGQQFRHDVFDQTVGQTLGDGFRNHEERPADGVVDPVIRRAAQTQPLAGDIAARQVRLVPVVDPDMTIDIEIAGLVGVVLHPALGQFLHPGARIAGSRHDGDLFPQRAHLRHPVQPNDLAEFSRRDMAQAFRPANAPQSHEAQGQEDVQGAIKALRQMEMLAQPA